MASRSAKRHDSPPAHAAPGNSDARRAAGLVVSALTLPFVLMGGFRLYQEHDSTFYAWGGWPVCVFVGVCPLLALRIHPVVRIALTFVYGFLLFCALFFFGFWLERFFGGGFV